MSFEEELISDMIGWNITDWLWLGLTRRKEKRNNLRITYIKEVEDRIS